MLGGGGGGRVAMGEPHQNMSLQTVACSVQLDFNVHIQSKLLQHTPVMGTQSSYQLGCLSRTEGQLLVVALLEIS